MGSDVSTHHWESWCLCHQLRNQQATWRVGYKDKHETPGSSATPLVSREGLQRVQRGSHATPSPFHLLLADLDVTWELSLLRLCSPEARTSSRKLTSRYEVTQRKKEKHLQNKIVCSWHLTRRTDVRNSVQEVPAWYSGAEQKHPLSTRTSRLGEPFVLFPRVLAVFFSIKLVRSIRTIISRLKFLVRHSEFWRARLLY